MKYLLFSILVLTTFSSCEFFRKLDKTQESSSDIKKENENTSSGDTSKIKSRSDYVRETWSWDTVKPVVNINVPEQKITTYPVYYQRETGSKSDEITLGMFYNFQKQITDSLNSFKQSKQSETKAEVLSVGHLIMIGMILILLLCIAVLFIYFQNKILHLKTK